MFYFLALVAILVQTIHGSDTAINARLLVDQINSNAKTWQADTYGELMVDPNHLALSKLGTELEDDGNLGFQGPVPTAATKSFASNSANDSNLPETFSWVEKNRNYGCPIGEIRDQTNCANSWAVAPASTFSDRVCIASKGKFTTPLSENHLTACVPKTFGCYGGRMTRAYEYLVNHGLMTGGGFESDIGCQPYSLRPCGGPGLFHCRYFSTTPKCKDKCTNEWYPTERETKITKASQWYVLPKNEEAIMKDIYEKGPVTAAFGVTIEFLFYKKGIFIPVDGSRPRRGHAVRVVGWGVENGVKYWHVANSWGAHWGEDGYFRIIRGVNACHFESRITTAIV